MDKPTKKLIDAFARLGIERGDHLLVHSSLRSLGDVPDRAAAVTGALTELLGESGTLLLPALSYETVTPASPYFSVTDTRSCVGWLSEYFRHQPGVRRSMHPTHSVCARGAESGYFLENHGLDRTPCGPNSPFRKLRDAGGTILFLGCGLRPNTSMHGVEELTAPPYLFGSNVDYALIDVAGHRSTERYRTHGFAGVTQRYDRVLELLDSSDYSRGAVLAADCHLIRAKPLWEKASRKLQETPLYFVDPSG